MHEIFLRGREDPVWWLERVYGEKLVPHQKAIIESLRDNEETTVRSSHSVGKSFIASRGVWWFACHFPGAYIVTTAPTANQVKDILWKEIRAFNRNANVISRPLGARMGTTTMELEAIQVKAVGYTARDSTSFQGRHADYVLVVADEASGISDDIYDAIDSILAGGKLTRLLEIGNPTNPSGRFAKRHSPKAKGTARRFKISAFDTPNFVHFGVTEEDMKEEERRPSLEAQGEVPAWERKVGGAEMPYPHLVKPAWVAKIVARLGFGSEYVRTRILAEFPTADSKSMFPMPLIEQAVANEAEPEYPHCLGVDVSRFGGDETVVYERKGWRFRLRDVWSKESTSSTAARVKLILQEDAALWVSIDSIGVGGGVVDEMASYEMPAYGVNVGMSPSDPERFGNLKAELYWNLKEAMEAGLVDLDPDDYILQEQMSRIRFEYRRGKVFIEGKDQYKKRSDGKSPDRLEALVMSLSDIFEADTTAVIV